MITDETDTEAKKKVTMIFMSNLSLWYSAYIRSCRIPSRHGWIDMRRQREKFTLNNDAKCKTCPRLPFNKAMA